MAFGHFSYTIGKKTAFLSFASLTLVLSTTATRAGFQWVPSAQETNDAPIVSPSYPEPSEVILPPPLPAEDILAAPVTQDAYVPPPQPAPIYVAPPVAQPAPVMQTRTIMPPPAQPIAPPPSISAPPSSGGMKIRTYADVRGERMQGRATAIAPETINFNDYAPVAPLPPPTNIEADEPATSSVEGSDTLKLPPRLPAGDKVVSEPLPLDPSVQQDAYVPPPLPVAVSEIVVEDKVIVPNDAPTSAIQTDERIERLNISSAPSVDQLEATQSDPIFAPQPQNPYPVMSAPNDIPPPPSANVPAANVIEGFGSDMPLVLALRQVVPPQYAFSFGSGIDAGSRVSWSGGKPWNEVVGEMIAPLGYNVRVSGRKVLIYAATLPPEAMAPAAISAPQVISEPTNTDSYFKMQELEPAAGHKETETKTPVEAPRNVRRINVMDPGDQAQAQPEIALQKMAMAANQAPTQLLQDIDVSSNEPIWSAKKDSSLKETLDAWSQKAGIQLVWDVSYDYQVQKDLEIQAPLNEAIGTLLRSSLDEKTALSVKFLPQTSPEAQQQVLIQDSV